MEQNPAAATLWRMWVDTKRRIVSFHEEKDCQLLEFLSLIHISEPTRP